MTFDRLALVLIAVVLCWSVWCHRAALDRLEGASSILRHDVSHVAESVTGDSYAGCPVTQN